MLSEKTTIRARLWVPGEAFTPGDNQPRLWLHLSDGRVLALRLGHAKLGDDAVIDPLVEALSDDLNGYRYSLELDNVGYVHVLYAAPVLPQARHWHAGFVLDPDFQHYAAGLDTEVLRLLVALERPSTPPAATGRPPQEPQPALPRYIASVRNYNRLAPLPSEQRERRLQALRRFPALVAPMLLTLHHSPNTHDGKRHAWRDKNDAVEAAIDGGRNLVDALAEHWKISRGLVRAPVNTAMWGGRETPRRKFLGVLDALPDNQRPTLEDFERWMPYLFTYLDLLAEEEDGGVSPRLEAVHRGAFRLGWKRTWETAAKRHGHLLMALGDCRDFIASAQERAAALLRRTLGPHPAMLTAGWVACHGLLGLLGASARWHRERPRMQGNDQPGITLPTIIGWHEEEGQTAEELVTWNKLVQEGASMHHCADSPGYWQATMDGARLIHLTRPDGEKATGEYRPRSSDKGGNDIYYRLVQLRGPCNQPTSPEMNTWAKRIEALLNAPERRNVREAATRARAKLMFENIEVLDRLPAWLDARSERQLDVVLDWLEMERPGPDVVLVAHVAGYQYHNGSALEARLAAGQPLSLVLEPDNPHDPMAVRVLWEGQMIGYLPRPWNTDIAARLLAGERLTARITAFSPDDEPWRRLELVVESRVETARPGNLGGLAH